jgi:hypothetical protein
MSWYTDMIKREIGYHKLHKINKREYIQPSKSSDIRKVDSNELHDLALLSVKRLRDEI